MRVIPVSDPTPPPAAFIDEYGKERRPGYFANISVSVPALDIQDAPMSISLTGGVATAEVGAKSTRSTRTDQAALLRCGSVCREHLHAPRAAAGRCRGGALRGRQMLIFVACTALEQPQLHALAINPLCWTRSGRATPPLSSLSRLSGCRFLRPATSAWCVGRRMQRLHRGMWALASWQRDYVARCLCARSHTQGPSSHAWKA